MKQNNQETEPPDSWIKLGLILLNVFIYALVALAWYNVLKAPENGSEGQLERENGGIILVEGNSLKASVPPITIRPQVLGIMTGGLPNNKAELLERLWFCEASYGHEGVWGDKGKAYGAFQYWSSTFNHYCEGSRYNFDDQLKCAEYMIFELGIGHQHWVNCWKRMELNKYIN